MHALNSCISSWIIGYRQFISRKGLRHVLRYQSQLRSSWCPPVISLKWHLVSIGTLALVGSVKVTKICGSFLGEPHVPMNFRLYDHFWSIHTAVSEDDVFESPCQASEDLPDTPFLPLEEMIRSYLCMPNFHRSWALQPLREHPVGT